MLAVIATIVAASLAGIVTALVPVFQGGISRDAGTHLVIVAVVLIIVSGLATSATLYTLSIIEPQCRDAKDLAQRLTEIYR